MSVTRWCGNHPRGQEAGVAGASAVILRALCSAPPSAHLLAQLMALH